jgi:hypothetical protein
MNLPHIFCILAVVTACTKAGDYLEQPLNAVQKIRADLESTIKNFTTTFTDRYTPLLNEFDLRLVNYLKSYTRIECQLSGIMQVVSIGRNFSVEIVSLTVSKHIKSVKLDVDTSATRTTLREIIFTPFFDTLETTTSRVAVIEAAVGRNPSYAKCYFDARNTGVKVYGELFFTTSPEIIEKNYKELNDKLECLAKDIDAYVIKIDKDLSCCVGKERLACIDLYVSLCFFFKKTKSKS